MSTRDFWRDYFISAKYIGLQAEEFWQMSPGETHCAFVAFEKRTKNEQEQEGIHHYNLMNALRFIATDIFNALRKRHSRKKPEQLWKLPYEHLIKKPKQKRQSRTEEDYLKILSRDRKKKKRQ